MSADESAWPALPLAEWSETRDTLHLWTQIVGKTRLALAPMVNHWWQVPLYVSARGLTTSWMPYRDAVEIADAIPFARDETHASYDAASAHSFWRALTQASRVLEIFRGRFVGKASPVHFFWGSFDLACTRFNGERAPQHPGGMPGLADWVTREGYSHACISAGWWPGTIGSPVAEPVFYAYAYPEPVGCPTAKIEPAAGSYHAVMHEWILPYEAVRTSAHPDAVALDFFQSTYEAAASLGGWDRAALERDDAANPK